MDEPKDVIASAVEIPPVLSTVLDMPYETEDVIASAVETACAITALLEKDRAAG